MKKLSFLAVALAAILSFCSCADKDEKEGIDFTSMEMTEGTGIQVYGTSEVGYKLHDLAASYGLMFRMVFRNGYLCMEDSVAKSDDFRLKGTYSTKSEIIDLGEGKSLISVDEYCAEHGNVMPIVGYSDSVVCQEGHMYLIRAWGSADLKGLYPTATDIKDCDPITIRMYVGKELKEGNGFEMRYQFPYVFVPVVE